MSEKNSDKYLLVQTVADKLSCTERHVYVLIQEGFLEAIRIGQRAVRISEESLLRFIEARKIQPGEDLGLTSEESKDEPAKIIRSNWMSR